MLQALLEHCQYNALRFQGFQCRIDRLRRIKPIFAKFPLGICRATVNQRIQDIEYCVGQAMRFCIIVAYLVDFLVFPIGRPGDSPPPLLTIFIRFFNISFRFDMDVSGKSFPRACRAYSVNTAFAAPPGRRALDLRADRLPALGRLCALFLHWHRRRNPVR